MKILALDIATTTGWAIMIDNNIEAGGHFKETSLLGYHKTTLELLDLWKPTHVITASPTRFFNTIFKHGQIFGAIGMALEKRDIEFWMDKTKTGRDTLPIDSKMKKAIFKKGVVAKSEICQRYNTTDEDFADACMFCEYLNKNLNA